MTVFQLCLQEKKSGNITGVTICALFERHRVSRIIDVDKIEIETGREDTRETNLTDDITWKGLLVSSLLRLHNVRLSFFL